MRQLFVCVCVCGITAVGCGTSSHDGKAAKVHKRDDAKKTSSTKPTNDAATTPTNGAADLGDPKTAPPPAIIRKHGRGDCSTAYAPRPKRDPNAMCKIDGGTFWMGTAAAVVKACNSSQLPNGRPVPCPSEDETPRHKVTMSGFSMDQFEVTNAQYVLFLNTLGDHQACEPGTNNPCVDIRPYPEWANIAKKGGTYVTVAGKERLPVTMVSYEGAVRYCRWVGKSLPTEAQWEYAARHDPKTGRDLIYPWGDTFEPKRAACSEKYCQDGFKEILPAIKDVAPERLGELAAPVGTFDGTGGFKDGSSPWGVHDLAANANELTADCYSETTYSSCKNGCADPTGPRHESCQAVTRSVGGVDGYPVNLRSAERGHIPRSSAFAGFRCVTTLPATAR